MLKKFLYALDHIEEILGCIVLFILCALLFFQVLQRFVFGSMMKQAEEIARYCLIWLAFIGASYGAKKRTHVEVGVLFDKIKSETVKRWYQVVVDIIVMVVFITVLPEAFNFTVFSARSTAPTMPFLRMSHVYVILPVGIALMCFRYAVNIYNGIRGKKDVERIRTD